MNSIMGCKLPFETIEEKPWDWKELSRNVDITTQDVLDDKSTDDSDYSDTDSEYVPSDNDDDDDDNDFDDYVNSDSDD